MTLKQAKECLEKIEKMPDHDALVLEVLLGMYGWMRKTNLEFDTILHRVSALDQEIGALDDKLDLMNENVTDVAVQIQEWRRDMICLLADLQALKNEYTELVWAVKDEK